MRGLDREADRGGQRVRPGDPRGDLANGTVVQSQRQPSYERVYGLEVV